MERLPVIFSLFLYFALKVSSVSVRHPLCSADESLALLQFKQSLAIMDYPPDYNYCKHSSYRKMMSWNRSTDCCTWGGVTCDRFTGHVIGLELSCSKLGGTLHPNSSLFELRHLQTLDLSLNSFWGAEIPQGIGKLVSLTHLNLSSCLFSGNIPLEITHLSNLVLLDISDPMNFLEFSQQGFDMLFQNLTKLEALSLSGVDISSDVQIMSTNISSSLRYLNLGGNNLRGDLPTSIFLLPNLETLKVSYNVLTISLPKSNWSSSHTLTELDLVFNNVSGRLPTSLGSLKALRRLNLRSCQLIGPIPESIRNLSQITEFDLSYNSLESEIPDVFSNLRNLTLLALDYNSFIGPFPSSLVNLKQLQVLRLGYSSLSGPLPLTANGLQNLKELDLSNNLLNGSLPSWMMSPPPLIHLTVQNNHFSGPLPEFKSKSLQQLDLSHNQLSGPIPQTLGDLVNLTILFLAPNNLSGKVGAEMFSSMRNLEQVDLSSQHLSGEIGTETFSSMSNLSYLDLSHSGLSWSSNKDDFNITISRLTYLGLSFCGLKDFPNFILNSKALEYLDLSENDIHGMFPVWFGSLSSLRILNLSHNYVTSLDHLPMQGMTVIDLHSNSLTGPLPLSLCKQSDLHLLVLDLSYNNLSAEIPSCLVLLNNGLSVLNLQANNFHGRIPNKFPKDSGLAHINLSKNQLEGPIPRSLVNCTSLQVLDLGNNKIHDAFPIWLETLPELQILILKSNRFYGPVAFQTKSPFPNVRIFDISGNSHTGPVPVEALKGFNATRSTEAQSQYFEADYGYAGLSGLLFNAVYEVSVTLVIKNQEIDIKRVLKIFTTIDLSKNKFEGEIPEFIGNLNSFRLLNLSHNNLNGHIPVEMKKLRMLEALDLSYNQLTGKIPQELTSLTFLAVLNLSHNHLAGPIPHGNQFNTFSNDSYVGNQDLCGFPLSNECGEKGKSPDLLVEQEEDESSFLSEMTWESVVIGYGCGLICGFSILYLIYRFERPRWFIDFFASITPPPRRGTISSNFQRRRR